MAAIQAALVKRPSSTAITSLATNDVPVWNGTTWVRPSGTGSSSTFLRGDGSWATPGTITYRKTTTKTVVNSTAETDLLNGEITAAAGVLGTSGVLRLTAWGDYIQSSGADRNNPRLKVRLGAGPTTVLDSNVNALSEQSSATRRYWRAVVEVMNLGATNSQLVSMSADLQMATTVADIGTLFATGTGVITYASAAAGNWTVMQMRGYNTAAIDTTAAMSVQLAVVNGVANASVDFTLKGALVEVI